MPFRMESSTVGPKARRGIKRTEMEDFRNLVRQTSSEYIALKIIWCIWKINAMLRKVNRW